MSARAEGGVPEQGDDQRAEQAGRLRADDPLGEVDQQDAPLGEDVARVGTWAGAGRATPRMPGRSRMGRSLFMSGAMAWVRSASEMPSNQAQNEPRPIGSALLACPTTERRKPGLVRSSGSMAKLASPRRASVSKQACRMSWVRGPQASA